MISLLSGVVASARADQVVLDVHGVGFAVAVPAALAQRAHVGAALRLHTHLVVREDALSLYGFEDAGELEVFALLLGVTGVGPRSALGVVSQLSIAQIAEAVANDDEAPLRRVPGIGPKTAKLIVMQLAGKLAPPAPAATGAAAPRDVAAQVVAALVGLGWTERVAADAVATAADQASEGDRSSVPALLRHTLATLGPAQAGVSRG